MKREVTTNKDNNGNEFWSFKKSERLKNSNGNMNFVQKLWVWADDNQGLDICVECFKDNISCSKEIRLNTVEGKKMRDWVVKQLPFSKQELVNMITEIA